MTGEEGRKVKENNGEHISQIDELKKYFLYSFGFEFSEYFDEEKFGNILDKENTEQFFSTINNIISLTARTDLGMEAYIEIFSKIACSEYMTKSTFTSLMQILQNESGNKYGYISALESLKIMLVNVNTREEFTQFDILINDIVNSFPATRLVIAILNYRNTDGNFDLKLASKSIRVVMEIFREYISVDGRPEWEKMFNFIYPLVKFDILNNEAQISIFANLFIKENNFRELFFQLPPRGKKFKIFNYSFFDSFLTKLPKFREELMIPDSIKLFLFEVIKFEEGESNYNVKYDIFNELIELGIVDSSRIDVQNLMSELQLAYSVYINLIGKNNESNHTLFYRYMKYLFNLAQGSEKEKKVKVERFLQEIIKGSSDKINQLANIYMIDDYTDTKINLLKTIFNRFPKHFLEVFDIIRFADVLDLRIQENISGLLLILRITP